MVISLLWTISVWYFSLFRIFQVETICLPMTVLVMATQVSDLLIEVMVKKKEQKDESLSAGSFLQENILSVIFLLYLVFLIVEENCLGTRSFAFIFVDLVFIIKIGRRLGQLSLLIRIKVHSSWRNEVEIAQLIGRCISLVHIFVLFLLFRVSSCTSPPSVTRLITGPSAYLSFGETGPTSTCIRCTFPAQLCSQGATGTSLPRTSARFCWFWLSSWWVALPRLRNRQYRLYNKWGREASQQDKRKGRKAVPKHIGRGEAIAELQSAPGTLEEGQPVRHQQPDRQRQVQLQLRGVFH